MIETQKWNFNTTPKTHGDWNKVARDMGMRQNHAETHTNNQWMDKENGKNTNIVMSKNGKNVVIK